MTDGLAGSLREPMATQCHIYTIIIPLAFPLRIYGYLLGAHALEIGEFCSGSELTLRPGDLKYYHVPITVWGIDGSNNQWNHGQGSA